jgi:hypothetical protein
VSTAWLFKNRSSELSSPVKLTGTACAKPIVGPKVPIFPGSCLTGEWPQLGAVALHLPKPLSRQSKVIAPSAKLFLRLPQSDGYLINRGAILDHFAKAIAFAL